MNVTPRRSMVRIGIGISIVAALGLGSATTALAEPKENSYYCNNLRQLYAWDLQALNDAYASGNQKAIRRARLAVFDDINAGYTLGCDWVEQL